MSYGPVVGEASGMSMKARWNDPSKSNVRRSRTSNDPSGWIVTSTETDGNENPFACATGAGPRTRAAATRHSAARLTALFPLDRARRFRGDVEGDAVDAGDLADDPVGDAF